MLNPRKDDPLFELRNVRHKGLSLGRAGFRPTKAITPSRQAINALAEANFRNAGFEREKYDALIKQSNAEARETMAQLQAKNDKQAPAMRTYLHGIVDNWSSNITNLKALDSPNGSCNHLARYRH